MFSIKSVILSFFVITMLKKFWKMNSFVLRKRETRKCWIVQSAEKRKLNALSKKSVCVVAMRSLSSRSSICKRLKIKKLRSNLLITWPGSSLKNNGKLRRINGAKKTKLALISWSKSMKIEQRLLVQDKCKLKRKSGVYNMRSSLLKKRSLALKPRMRRERWERLSQRRITKLISWNR